MVRFLLISAVICVLGSVGLGFFNRSKLAEIQRTAVEALNREQMTRTFTEDLQKRLKQTEERLTTQERLTIQERESRNTELNTIRTKLNTAQEQLIARENEVKALTTALTEAGRVLSQKQNAEQERQQLTRRLLDVEQKLNSGRLERRGELDSDVTMEGTVISMNPDAKALTVSLGNNVGVTGNSRLTVLKNGEPLSQLRVVSVDNESCVAEFVDASPDNFARVAIGDPVVLNTR
jgi:septal ring factor EnvC (AmiA/AmiB activator)